MSDIPTTEDKHAGGRPSKYDPKYNKQVVKLCRLGATDKDLASFFEVTETTINNWKIDYPEFFESLKKGKEESDNNVADSLYKRAIGYQHTETKVFNNRGQIITKDVIARYPPDPTSMIFWLKNRRPDLWRDKQEIDNNVNLKADRSILEIIANSLNKKDEV
jgi:hypothetical protein